MQILIAGDIVPTKSNMNLFENGNVDILLGNDLLSLWNSADIRIFNLEVPLIDEESPIEKWGPNLIASTSTINGIKALAPSLVTLANNHILDQGANGLHSTLDILNKHNIPYVGAGQTLDEATIPYIIHTDLIKIGVYACAEHEFSIATEKTPGANPFDPLESLEHIHKLNVKCDYVIVLYHGGKEHYRYPSPYLQKVCRKMAKAGADLIVCQHSHCIGCVEEYEGSTIVYGQGNFIFDNSESEFWQTSLLIKVNIIREKLSISFIPIIKNGNGIKLANEKESNGILSAFQKRSIEILQADFVERRYKEFAKLNLENYLRCFTGMGKWVSRIDKYLLKGKLVKAIYCKRNLLAIQNYIECEAHKELFLAGLKSYRK